MDDQRHTRERSRAVPEGHGEKVARLIERLEHRQGYTTVKLAWASGLMIAASCSHCGRLGLAAMSSAVMTPSLRAA
jgi:hypothetical protein